jgi:hypothetical protein
MEPDPLATPGAAGGLRVVSQPVSAPLTRAAIFLVVTINPGADNRATLRSFCADLSALLRALKAYQERCEARTAFQKAMAGHLRPFQTGAP